VIEQIWLFVLSSSCTFLSHDTRHGWRKWAPFVGLAAQPAWYYSTWIAHQWGAFALTLVITYCHLRGVWLLWWKPRRFERQKREVMERIRKQDHDRSIFRAFD